MELLETINKRLLENYGRGVGDQPRYRVSYTSSQREMRTGLMVKRTEAGIYLGEAVRTEEVEKYPNDPETWVLEYVQPNLANPELHATVSYEPLWFFKDRNNNPLPYDWEVIEKIVYFHIHREPPKTKSMLDHDFEEKKKAEEASFLDQLKHEDPFPNKMYGSDVVTIPGQEKPNV